MSSKLVVYQLALGAVFPANAVAGELVVDPNDPDKPYSVVFHLSKDQLNLPDLLSEGRAVLKCGDPVAALGESPPLALVCGE